MRVVLDTNVIVSALISPQGIPSQIFHYWELLYFDLLVSAGSLDELWRVLHYPKIRNRLRSSDEELGAFITFLQNKGVWVTHSDPSKVIADDLSDNLYLEIALVGHAHYVVSGDQHLLRLKEYQGIPIVAPIEFFDRLTASTSDTSNAT